MRISLCIFALFSLAVVTAPARAQFLISEIMADNVNSSDVDEDTSHSDWLEILNNGTTSASLNGWYLTDTPGNLRLWRFPVTTPALTLAPGARIVVWCSDKNRKAVATKLHTNFKLSNNGEFLALVRPDGVTIEHSFNPFPPQFPNSTWGLNQAVTTTVVVAEGAAGKVKAAADEADFTNNFTGWNSSPTFDDSSWQAGSAGFGYTRPEPPYNNLYATLIGANGTIAVPNQSYFVRFTFNQASLAGVSAVRLKAKYDDGYVCYLNGTKIAEKNPPAPPLTWNSSAVLNRTDSLAFSPEAVTVAGSSALVAGTNVLAFHVLDFAAVDEGALMRPSFEVDASGALASGYFVSSTRGSTNSAFRTTIGPSIGGTTDEPNQPPGGAGSPPLVITTKITPTLRPLFPSNPVTLKWRRMFDAETTLVMSDNGLNGDVTAGDGTYTALVPTTTLQQGEMIRWRIEAKDQGSVVSYDPPYPFTSAPTNPPATSVAIESEMYHGTVATPVMVGNTQLPVLHWFMRPSDEGTVNDSETGAVCSFFFKPLPEDNPGPNYVPPKARFYDNVVVKRHGQSSTGFPKRSHDLGFAKDNKFVYKDGDPDSSGVNLLSNYADKSKVRNTMAWWAWEKSGHIASHYSQIVRVQRNGAFRGIYDLVENGNAAWLDREKLDKGDALYKMYESLLSAAIVPTLDAVNEKKNPDNSDNSDLQAFVAGIASGNGDANRLRYIYDHVDVESLINYMAVHCIILNRDFGHKNYYVYRDSSGTGEWHPLPWDQDLSLGHTWNNVGSVGTPHYYDDDIHSQGPLQTGGGGNALMQLVFQRPELRAIYLRRVRTLADLFFVSSTEMNGPLAQKGNATVELIDPTPNQPATGTDDADLEMRAFGFWVDATGTGNGQAISFTDPRVNDHTARNQAARIISSNSTPTPYPGANPYAGWGDNTTSMLAFIPGRRDFFFNPTPPNISGVPLPPSQTPNPTLVIEQIDYNPAIGNQSQEFFVIRNPNNFAVDLSGWKLSGDISLTFRGGTVIPAQGTSVTPGSLAASYINQMVVANKPQGFRARLTSPRGSEFRFVVGPYDRQLSARGGSIILSKPNNPLDLSAGYTVVQTQNFTGNPTASQNFLRITELNYQPAPPTPGELSQVPGLAGSDFEFIELINNGPATLNLGKAFFEEGIGFTFPDNFMLASGQRCLVVASQAAFEARYGTGHPIAGSWEGSLDNAGERLRIVDSVGEEVLDFSYSPEWFPLPAGFHRSLVTRSPSSSHTVYSNPTTWALSGNAAGSPNAPDTGYSTVYEGWRLDYFTPAELPTEASPDLPAALTQDPDLDGLNNFEEYVFAHAPKVSDHTTQLTVAGLMSESGSTYLTITFVRPRNALDVIYNVEGSHNLTNPSGWATTGILVNTVDLGNGREQVTYRDSVPVGTGTRHLRVRAAKN